MRHLVHNLLRRIGRPIFNISRKGDLFRLEAGWEFSKPRASDTMFYVEAGTEKVRVRQSVEIGGGDSPPTGHDDSPPTGHDGD